ncbi:MAG: efflux RND transporter periplasmic adaptor subunit [Planctomycetales bacterium]|jgi:multidrug efflux pump subunit AcrA (membrane-fusion protein)
MKHLSAWTFGSIGAALVAVLAVVATSDQAVEAQEGKPDLVKAYDCSIQLIDVVTLAAERPGILESDTPEEGTIVQAGQVIAGLKDGVAKATYLKELEKAENDVHIKYAAKSSEFADADLAMSVAANDKVKGTVPEAELAKQRLAAEKAYLQIEQAEHEQRIAKLTVKESEEALKTYQVIAPFSGIVSKVYQRKGEAVQQGTPILEVLSIERVKIEGYVSIIDSFRVKAGDTVEVQLDATDSAGKPLNIPFRNEKLVGKIKIVDTTISTIIGSVKVTAEIPNPSYILRPGLKAKMDITPSNRTTAIGLRR